MTDKKFSSLTLTEQRAFVRRLAAGLHGAEYKYFKILQQVDPILKNCGIRGIAWAYLEKESFKQFINILKSEYD